METSASTLRPAGVGRPTPMDPMSLNRLALCAGALLLAPSISAALPRIPLSGASGPVAQDPPALATARAKLQAQDLAGAEADCRAILEASPEHPQAWFLLGYTLHAAGKVEAALEAHRKASGYPSVAPTACYNAACASALLGKTDEAFTWLTQARDAGFAQFGGIAQDADLVSLREDPRWASFLPKPPDSKEPFLEDCVILHDHFGHGNNSQFGWVARRLGDVDADGIQDYASTAPFELVKCNPCGAVYVYSGASGELLHRVEGQPGESFGWSVAQARDFDRDGHDDFLIGAPSGGRNPGRSYLFSGKTGETLAVFEGENPGDRFGEDGMGIGDVNGDGVPDVFIGAPRRDAQGQDSGELLLISGKDKSVLRRIPGEKAGDQLGGAIAGQCWGGQDLLVASAVNAGPQTQGRTYVYSSGSEEPRFVIDAEPGSRNIGWFISLIGDVDADGVQDVYSSDWHDCTAVNAGGRAVVHSGATGERLLDLYGGKLPGEGFGIGVARAGDLDRDGHDDLVVGAWQNRVVAVSAGRIYLYSGKDGAQIGVLTGAIPGDTLGFDATGIGDVDGDEVPDLLITSAYNGTHGTKAGRTYVVSGASCLTLPPDGKAKSGEEPAKKGSR